GAAACASSSSASPPKPRRRSRRARCRRLAACCLASSSAACSSARTSSIAARSMTEEVRVGETCQLGDVLDHLSRDAGRRLRLPCPPARYARHGGERRRRGMRRRAEEPWDQLATKIPQTL